jgi:hypothetical protein
MPGVSIVQKCLFDCRRLRKPLMDAGLQGDSRRGRKSGDQTETKGVAWPVRPPALALSE